MLTNGYMYKPESVLENEMYKIIWDFEIEMDHQFPARRPSVGKHLEDFAVPVDDTVKITVTRVQIQDETDCISHSTNTLGKGMNPIILPPAMGK